MHQFYSPDIATSLTLSPEESQHAVRVLRLSEGDEIDVVDGCGMRYRCRIAMAHQKHCKVEIVEAIEQPTHWHCSITIAIAPTKNLDRIEWMAEKCTEAGVDRIIPICCRFSERKATLPQLDEMTPISSVLDAPFDGDKFIAYCDRNIERKTLVREYRPGRNVLILIGPEGDFSQQEVEHAIACGFVPVTLGESRFRTESAAVFACNAIHVINQQHEQ